MTAAGPLRTLKVSARNGYMYAVADQARTDEKRMRAAVRKANWASLRDDLYRARVYIAVFGLLVIALVVFASEPSRDLGSVEGRIVAFNQADSRWPNPARTITVRLDDGRTAIVWTSGRALPPPNTRVRLRETEHLGWWRRTTFRLDRTPASETQ